MRGRRRIAAAILCALAAIAVVAALVATSGGAASGPASASKSGFTPSKIAGKWVGTWENTTFHSSGDVRANIQSKPGNKMVVLIDFSGNVFGCPDPTGTPQTLKKGKGKNHWNSSGFVLSKGTPVFGQLSLTYKFSKKTLKGSGSAPPCNSTITYTLEGKLTPKKLNATVAIDLGSQNATSVISATKTATKK